MKLFAGLLLPGLWLVLLSCCCRVQSENQASGPVSAVSNGTKDQAPSPVPATSNGTTVAIPGINTTATTPQKGTLPIVPSAGPSNTTAPTPTNTTRAATSITTPSVNTTSAKTSTTKAPPAPSESANVTAVTPKAPSSANDTITATAKAAATLSRSSGFDVGSFIGGIVLTLGLLIIGYIGCRTYHAKRGIQYRTIDEHDAII